MGSYSFLCQLPDIPNVVLTVPPVVGETSLQASPIQKLFYWQSEFSWELQIEYRNTFSNLKQPLNNTRISVYKENEFTLPKCFDLPTAEQIDIQQI